MRATRIVLLLTLATPAAAQAYIQEYCNDPVGGFFIGIDTNFDGVLSDLDDEFVEIVNPAATVTVDISNYTLEDAAAVRHTFPNGTMLPPGSAIVVFGGGNVAPFNALGYAAGVTASTGGLGLDNTGDTIILRDAMGNVVDTHTFASGGPDDGDGESITRDPEMPTGSFVRHSLAPPGIFLHSAGRKNTGTPYLPAQVPPPPVVYPGNGSDVAIDVTINGVGSTSPTLVETVVANDIVLLRFHSPAGTLDFAPFIAAFQVIMTGQPTQPILLPGDPINSVWLSPAIAIAFINGTAVAGAPLAPTLTPGGFFYGGFPIPPSFGGMGFSLQFQAFAVDPGRNAVSTGTSDAWELIIN